MGKKVTNKSLIPVKWPLSACFLRWYLVVFFATLFPFCQSGSHNSWIRSIIEWWSSVSCRIYLMPDERRYLQSKFRKKTCNPKFEESYVFQVGAHVQTSLTCPIGPSEIAQRARSWIVCTGNPEWKQNAHLSLYQYVFRCIVNLMILDYIIFLSQCNARKVLR